MKAYDFSTNYKKDKLLEIIENNNIDLDNLNIYQISTLGNNFIEENQYIFNYFKSSTIVPLNMYLQTRDKLKTNLNYEPNSNDIFWGCLNELKIIYIFENNNEMLKHVYFEMANILINENNINENTINIFIEMMILELSGGNKDKSNIYMYPFIRNIDFEILKKYKKSISKKEIDEKFLYLNLKHTFINSSKIRYYINLGLKDYDKYEKSINNYIDKLYEF